MYLIFLFALLHTGISSSNSILDGVIPCLLIFLLQMDSGRALCSLRTFFLAHFWQFFGQLCCIQPIFKHFLLIRAVLKFVHFDCAKISTARILIHVR